MCRFCFVRIVLKWVDYLGDQTWFYNVNWFVSDDLPPHLYGLTFYGENIQDEWYIVEIVNHLTKIYPHVIGRIFDADGEFLLIEAADVLPRWANPDTCAQRVTQMNLINCLVFKFVPEKILFVANSDLAFFRLGVHTQWPYNHSTKRIRWNWNRNRCRASDLRWPKANPRRCESVWVGCDNEMHWRAFCWHQQEYTIASGMCLFTDLRGIITQTKSTTDIVCGACIL